MLPYGRHSLDEDDFAAVERVLRGGWLTCGPAVEEFEAEIARQCGAAHAVACHSGTAALHLALLAADVGPGDDIVVPAVTFLSTANCGVLVGALPKFADVDPDSALVTPELLEPVLTERTRAVLPVHFAGLPCDMEEIRSLVRDRCPEAVVVEDACHALGARHPDGSPVGSLGRADMATLSFHPVKHIAAGEGGIVLTDRDDLAARLRRLRNHGMTKEPSQLTRPDEGPWYYEMHEPGLNYRMSDISCALGLSQVKKLDRFVARRREIAARYHRELAGVPHLDLPPPADPANSSWHLYCTHIDFPALGRSRGSVVAELAERGVGTQVHYFPVPLQPYYRRLSGAGPEDFPGAVRHYDRALTIPLFPAMRPEEESLVIDAVRGVLAEAGS